MYISPFLTFISTGLLHAHRLLRGALAHWQAVAERAAAAALLAELDQDRVAERHRGRRLLAGAFAAWRGEARAAATEREAAERRQETWSKIHGWLGEMGSSKAATQRRAGILGNTACMQPPEQPQRDAAPLADQHLRAWGAISAWGQAPPSPLALGKAPSAAGAAVHSSWEFLRADFKLPPPTTVLTPPPLASSASRFEDDLDCVALGNSACSLPLRGSTAWKAAGGGYVPLSPLLGASAGAARHRYSDSDGASPSSTDRPDMSDLYLDKYS